jgi:6-phosphofructokinase 1
VKLETGYCGYLTTMSALASGADISYIFEEEFTVNHIKKDISVLKSKMKNDDRNRFVLM